MGRYDDRDRDLEKRFNPVSNALIIIVFVFAMGFILGIVWSMAFLAASPPDPGVNVQALKYGIVQLSSLT